MVNVFLLSAKFICILFPEMLIKLYTRWGELQQKHTLRRKYCSTGFSTLDSISRFQCDNHLSIYNIDQFLSS